MDPSQLFYHDMHNRYGETLTRKSLGSKQRYSELWAGYATCHPSLDHLYQELLLEYIERFRSVPAPLASKVILLR